jgi:hypothetical protein
VVAKQGEKDQQNDDDPETAQSVAAIIAAIIAVIPAPATEEQNQNNDEEQKGHDCAGRLQERTKRPALPEHLGPIWLASIRQQQKA